MFNMLTLISLLVGISMISVVNGAAYSPALKGPDCTFPLDRGLVPVTPWLGNGGWAISPDQRCSRGSWCPYACPPGQASTQWDPALTIDDQDVKRRMHGGLYCNHDGVLEQPFPGKALCFDQTGPVVVDTHTRQSVSICQTVFPGNEAQLIPNSCPPGKAVRLAVTDEGNALGAGTHYYINSPGVSTADACRWGEDGDPSGNWAPFVLGFKYTTDLNGGYTNGDFSWNPKYIERRNSFAWTRPRFGVRLSCSKGGRCENLPVVYDPRQRHVNEIDGQSCRPGVATPNEGPKALTCSFTVYTGSQVIVTPFDVGE